MFAFALTLTLVPRVGSWGRGGGCQYVVFKMTCQFDRRMSRTGSNRIGKVSVSRVNLNVELEEQVKQDCQSGNEN